MPYELTNLFYLIPLLAIGVAFLLVVLKKRRDMKQILHPLDLEEERESLANPIAITAALFGGLAYAMLNTEFQPILPFPLDVITLIWYGAFLAVFTWLCIKERRRYTGPPFEVKEEGDLSLKYEAIRKATHVVIVLVIVCYVAFGPVFFQVVNWLLGILPWFGVSGFDAHAMSFAGQYTVTFLTVIAFLGLATSEVVRVFFYRAYPLKKVKAIFRRKETGAALGSHISLAVGSLFVVLVFGWKYPGIAMASIAISAIADGAAGIIGRRFGKHQYSTVFSRKRKTLEGLLTATVVSIVLSLSLLIYQFGPASFIMAFVATLVLDGIDLLSIQISDNLLNPIATSTVLVLVAFTLRVA
ncbi:MAG: diacylglycerol/polyprenol kinase family protein [Candidatus Sigynarchaeum springense]